MIPTVGRIVFYTTLSDNDPQQYAAIITKVKPQNNEGSENREERRHVVSLHIFYETGQLDMIDAPFSEKFERGHWTWPPRV